MPTTLVPCTIVQGDKPEAGQVPLEELVESQARSVDLRQAVMACLSGKESRRWTVLELVERLKNLGIRVSRAGARGTGARALGSSSRGACSNEGPNGSSHIFSIIITIGNSKANYW